MYYALGCSVVLGLAWIFESRAAIYAFFTRKSTYYGANVAFIVLLVLGILVFANIIAKDHHWRKDITHSGVNSLSPQSVKVLKGLPQPVKAYYFSTLQEKDKGEDLLKNYAYQSKKFTYEFVDTARRPTFVQTMDVKKNETLVLTLPGTNKKTKVEGVTEEKITNGLIRLLKTKEQSVYFTVGHGERALTGGDPLGYASLKNELEKQGYTVKELNLFSEGKIPADASLLIVAGPTRAFFPKEIDLLSSWLKGGGHAIFAVDLSPADNGLAKGSQQIAALLKPYGVDVQSRMLVDPTSKAANVEPQVLLGFSGSREHPVTKDFAYSPLAANFLFPLTTYIEAHPAAGYQETPLVVTSQNAWAESDWESLKSGLVSYNAGQDKKGRMPLAVAVQASQEQEEGKEKASGPDTKLVVFGTSTFASDRLLDKVGNRDLFLNAAAWLVGDNQLISIRPKEAEALQQFNNATLNLVLLITVFLMPVLLIIGGVTIWLRRSKL
jgi:ABC-type uncharacterized transport system involved in gliding motility auxiliary subunit